MNIYIISLVVLSMNSCSNNYEQSYKNFTEFNASSTRLKSWFPNLVDSDYYNFKEIHNLEYSNSYGRFSYKDFLRIDSILNNSNLYKEISIDTLNLAFKKILNPKRPNWFLNNEEILSKKIYEKKTMILIEDETNRSIYFLYTSVF